MTKKPKILITSAAGNTGIPTSLQLLERGYPVRALVHREDHRSQRLKDAGAEIFVGDQCALSDMRRAMDGIQRAYHCAPSAPNGLHFGSVFAVAAAEAKLEHIVMMGQWLSSPDHPSMLTREVWLNEEVLKLLPETTVTVNNVGWFAENYFWVLEPMAQLGVFPMPLGDGNVKKNAPPSNEDIAAVNVAALADPEVHAGKTYRPTGPELLSPNDISAIVGKVLGRKVKYQNISETMLLKALTAQGFPEAMPPHLRYYADEYRRGTFAINAPNDVVRSVVGREPEDFETITRRVIASRAEAVRSVSNKLTAFRNFLKIALTEKVDPYQIERRRNHVLLNAPLYGQDSETWRGTHDPAAGFVADRPRVGAGQLSIAI